MAQISRKDSGITLHSKSKLYSLVLAILTLAIFVLLVYSLDINKPSSLDIQVIEWVDQHAPNFLSGFLTLLTEAVTYWSIPIVVLIAMLWLGWRKRDLIGVIILPIAVAISEILKGSIKDFFQRPRPEINIAVDGTGFSFPSGHALVGLVCYGLIAYFLVKYTKRTIDKWIISIIFILFIGLLGFNRIYFSVHYFTDIMAGYFLGLTILCVSIFIYESISELKIHKKNN
ncbi:phosphatase PAP2 family protein [Chengkuizengella marina]|uniref:phosphatase PAP2 family protein n=1 Tax=Chengkuizengella marina TaxID=2507566 RepID=UPI001371CAF5|nr:phosphatase PAP2 family protein [Chengkuizengella marina]